MNLLTKRDFAAGKAIELAQIGYSPERRPRWTISHSALAPIAIACDAIVIFAISVLSDLAYQVLTIGRTVDLLQYAGLGAIVAALFIALGKNGKLYGASELLNLKSQARQIAINWVCIFLFLATVGFTMKAGANFLPRRDAFVRGYRSRRAGRRTNHLAHHFGRWPCCQEILGT